MINQCQLIWNECLTIIKDNIPEKSYTTWFAPIVPLTYENNVFTVEVPSPFFVEFLEERFVDLIKRSLFRAAGNQSVKLEYKVIIDGGIDQENPVFPSMKSSASLAGGSRSISGNTIQNPFIIPGIKNINVDPQLNPNYSFDNFIEGTCNRLVRSTGNSIAENPGNTPFNPLFIYGGSGLGKTHVAQAIGLRVRELFPKMTVLFVGASKFLTQYTDSARKNTTNDFLNFYQMVDVLIVDDIQEIAGEKRAKTQNTFFHIFNHLHQLGKQLILTSDCPPAELVGFEERMLTRFKWGLTAELEKPVKETRLLILKNKAQKDGLPIAEDVLNYIAENISQNVRELEGALLALMAQSMHNNKCIDMDLARKVVGNVVESVQRNITVERIQSVVCEYFNVNKTDILSKSRKREIAQARQVAMYLSKNMTKESLSQIGSKLGKRDHSTVLYACGVVRDLMETDKNISKSVKEITARLSVN